MTTPTSPPPLLPKDRPLLHSVGIAAWCVVGIVAAIGVAVYGVAAISSLVLPLLFAAVFAVLASPLQRRLGNKMPSSAAAGIIVFAIAAIVAAIIAMMVVGIIDQSDRITTEVESALQEFDISDDDIDELVERAKEFASGAGSGAAGSVAAGLSAAGSAVVGLFLGAIIFYYLLKDGAGMRQRIVERAPADQRRELNVFINETFLILRKYWLGRAIVSAVVAVVVAIGALVLGLPLVFTIGIVTFIGGFIPYVGAFLGGALAVLVALGGSGITAALIMLGVVLVANVVIENLVEPLVTGKTLEVHPLVVLLATTLGATVAGIPGMIMAVPMVVITQRAVPIVRSFTGRGDLDGIPNGREDLPVGTDPIDTAAASDA